MRVRFTAKSWEWWEDVLRYAKDTNRTPSELVCEALDQIQSRYPKRRHAMESDINVLAQRVADILGVQVPAGTLAGKN